MISVGDRRAEYAREVLYLCDIPLNALDNLAGVADRFHRATRSYHSDIYYRAWDTLLALVDPRLPGDRNLDCDKSKLSPSRNSVAKSILSMAKRLIREDKFPEVSV